MEKILSVYKPAGLTPLQLIKKLRKQNPDYRDIKIGYAGRLDPLAHGVMLLLIGEENKNRQPYLNLPKTYKFSVLFGVATDSYDYLGLLQSLEISLPPTPLRKKILEFIKNHTGTFTQTYPPFSSKTINGIQMYKLAKRGKLDRENLPTREVEIFNFRFLSIEKIPSEKIKQTILKNLKKVTGHFRQKKITSLWEELFKLSPDHIFALANFEIECSSGTYVRSLANKMGQEFNCGAIAFEIFRIRVGKFDLENTFKIVA